MKTITQLTNDLSTLFDSIQADAVNLKKASELNNTAGNLLKAYQVQLAYHVMRGEAPDIPALAAESVMRKTPSIREMWKKELAQQ